MTRLIGLEVLDALWTSEYADEHEFDVVDAAVAPTLDNYADREGHAFEDEDGPNPSDEAHLGQDDPRERADGD